MTVGSRESATSSSHRGGKIGSVGSARSSTRPNRSRKADRQRGQRPASVHVEGEGVGRGHHARDVVADLGRVGLGQRVVDLPHLGEVDRGEGLEARLNVVPLHVDNVELGQPQRLVDR
jgi:hypothetical protein